MNTQQRLAKAKAQEFMAITMDIDIEALGTMNLGKARSAMIDLLQAMVDAGLNWRQLATTPTKIRARLEVLNMAYTDSYCHYLVLFDKIPRR
ncbi:MAG TPA: hypothetical protein VLF41_02060 [Candidatus Nanoarchaeia archaeon]|nr:hypothetical protein [Candidatus Nanoarchaeia archaeon]